MQETQFDPNSPCDHKELTGLKWFSPYVCILRRKYSINEDGGDDCINDDLLISTVFQEKAMAPHSSTLAWKIPWMKEPGRLQSMGSLRVGHDWATSLSLFTFMHWRRKWQPTPVFLPGESQGRGTWWAAVSGVAQSWTRLKWLSSNSVPGTIHVFVWITYFSCHSFNIPIIITHTYKWWD